MEQKNNSMPEMNDIQTFANDSIIDNLFDTNNNLDNTITQESHYFHNLETGIPDMDHNYLSQLLHAVMESESKKSAVDFVSMSEVERIPASEINAFNDFRPSSESNFQSNNTNDKEEDKSSVNESKQDLSYGDDDNNYDNPRNISPSVKYASVRATITATKSGLNENGINKSRRLWDEEEVSIFLNHFKEDYALYQKNRKEFYEKMSSKYFTSRSKGAIQNKLSQLLDKYEEIKSNSAKYNWKCKSNKSADVNSDNDVSEVESHEVMIVDHKINNNNFIEAGYFMEDDYVSDGHYGTRFYKRFKRFNDNANSIINPLVNDQENNKIDNGVVENRNCIGKKRRIGISSACIIADAIKESVMYRERMWEENLKFENENLDKEYEIQKNRIELEIRQLQFERQQLRLEHDNKLKGLEFTQEGFRQKLLLWIVIDDQPFVVTEDRSFREMLAGVYINILSQVTVHHDLSKKIKELVSLGKLYAIGLDDDDYILSEEDTSESLNNGVYKHFKKEDVIDSLNTKPNIKNAAEAAAGRTIRDNDELKTYLREPVINENQDPRYLPGIYVVPTSASIE
nr:5316_t:CDS:10 [Entrophospora candida]